MGFARCAQYFRMTLITAKRSLPTYNMATYVVVHRLWKEEMMATDYDGENLLFLSFWLVNREQGGDIQRARAGTGG